MKKSTHDFTTPVDKQQYKKKYLLRKLEDEEATAIIRDAKKSLQVSEVQGMDEKEIRQPRREI